jgi:hypothetical protein
MRFHPTVRRLQVVLTMAIGIMAALPAAALPNRSIGAVTAGSANPWQGPTDRSLEQMIGHKLVFLEKAPHERASGYDAFRIVSSEKSVDGQVPTYSEYVGKRILVESVEPGPTGEYTVTATAIDTGVQLQTTTMARAIAGVAPVGDYYRAKRRWLGKTIFTRKRTLQTYNAATNQYGELPVRMNEPLKVVDVIWGMSATKPLWVVVQRDNGDQGFIATAFSWTNAYQDWWNMARPWEDKIAETTVTQEMRTFGIAGRIAPTVSVDDDHSF